MNQRRWKNTSARSSDQRMHWRMQRKQKGVLHTNEDVAAFIDGGCSSDADDGSSKAAWKVLTRLHDGFSSAGSIV